MFISIAPGIVQARACRLKEGEQIDAPHWLLVSSVRTLEG
jgi:hypothetical protein